MMMGHFKNWGTFSVYPEVCWFHGDMNTKSPRETHSTVWKKHMHTHAPPPRAGPATRVEHEDRSFPLLQTGKLQVTRETCSVVFEGPSETSAMLPL